MEKDLSYNDAPKVFLHCQHAACALTDTCLRYQVSLLIPPSVSSFSVVNPAYVEQQSECPYFKSFKKVRYALGIKQLFDNIPYNKAVKLKSRVFNNFSRRTYYRIASKERMLSPKEQAYIRFLFKQEGIEEEPMFDEYIEKYDW